MHFDFGQEPAGVTDRLIVFERLFAEYEASSGEVLGAQVKCAVLLESSAETPDTLVAHLWFTCLTLPSRDREWKVTQWRDGHGSRASQR